MELILIALVPTVTFVCAAVTLYWVVPAAGEHYFRRRITR
jgi:hypothetical protein